MTTYTSTTPSSLELEAAAAIAAAADAASLPLRKRKAEHDDDYEDANDEDATPAPSNTTGGRTLSKAREVRLEQNRKAARESRRRKKIMIEELQRSVVFFSRANATLKQQNDELQRLLFATQARIQSLESVDAAAANGNPSSSSSAAANANPSEVHKVDLQAAQQAVATAQAQAAQVAATQALFQNQGFPPAAARAAAQTFAGTAVVMPSSASPTPPAPVTNVSQDLDQITMTAQQWQQHMQFLAAQLQQQQQQQQQMTMMNWFSSMNNNNNNGLSNIPSSNMESSMTSSD